MIEALVFANFAALGFLFHETAEKMLVTKRKRDIRIKIKGYHVHHSFFGLVSVAGGALFAGPVAAGLFGYGVGNIWQHKITHNRVKEKGMVFITKLQSEHTT